MNHRLREALKPLGKNRLEFVNDIRKLYNFVRREEYEAKGKRLPVGKILSLDEEKTFGQYLFTIASCLTTSVREHIHIFNINTPKSLKETIYEAFIQGKTIYSKSFIN